MVFVPLARASWTSPRFLKIKHQRVTSGQVRMALAFFTILGVAIIFFLYLLIYNFINGSKEIKEDAEDSFEEDSEEEDSEED